MSEGGDLPPAVLASSVSTKGSTLWNQGNSTVEGSAGVGEVPTYGRFRSRALRRQRARKGFGVEHGAGGTVPSTVVRPQGLGQPVPSTVRERGLAESTTDRWLPPNIASCDYCGAYISLGTTCLCDMQSAHDDDCGLVSRPVQLRRSLHVVNERDRSRASRRARERAKQERLLEKRLSRALARLRLKRQSRLPPSRPSTPDLDVPLDSQSSVEAAPAAVRTCNALCSSVDADNYLTEFWIGYLGAAASTLAQATVFFLGWAINTHPRLHGRSWIFKGLLIATSSVFLEFGYGFVLGACATWWCLATQWFPDLTICGDVESNPGPLLFNTVYIHQWVLKFALWEVHYYPTFTAYLYRTVRHYWRRLIVAPTRYRIVTREYGDWLTDSRWRHDLVIDGDVESNPGPGDVPDVTLAGLGVPGALLERGYGAEDLRSALMVVRATSQDYIVTQFANTALDMVDLYTAPTWAQALVRLACHSDSLTELTTYLREMWFEFHAPESQSGSTTDGRALLVSAVLRTATLVSATKLLGHIPSERFRSMLAAVFAVTRDKDDLEAAVRGAIETLLVCVPQAIMSGDWTRVFGSPDIAEDLNKATLFMRQAGTPNPETFTADYEDIRMVLERLEAAAANPARVGVALTMTLGPLRTAVMAMHASANASRRVTPFAFELIGKPGCGKTTFAGILLPLLIRATGGAVSPHSITTYREGKFSGDFLHPWTSAVLIDDALSSKEVGPIAGQYGEFVTFLHQLISSQPYPTETADLTGKTGRFTAPRVVAYVANQRLDVALMFVARELDAIRRRFVRIEVLEFGQPIGDNPATGYAKSWRVRVSRFNVATSQYDVIVETGDFTVWVGHVVRLAREHCMQQRSLLRLTTSDCTDSELSAILQSQAGECDVTPLSGVLFFPLLALQITGLLALVGAYARWLRPVTTVDVALMLLPYAPTRVLLRLSAWVHPESKLRQWCHYVIFTRAAPLLLVSLAGIVAAVWSTRRRSPVSQSVSSTPYDWADITSVVHRPVGVVPRLRMSRACVDWMRANPLNPYVGMAKFAEGKPKLEWSFPLRQSFKPPMASRDASGTSFGLQQVARSLLRLWVGARAGDPRCFAQTGLMIGRGYVMTVAHAFPVSRQSSHVTIVTSDPTGTGVQLCVAAVAHCDVIVDRTRDIALLYVPGLAVPEHVGTGAFVRDTPKQPFAILAATGNSNRFTIRGRRCDVAPVLSERVDIRGDAPRGPAFTLPIPGELGDCGSLCLDAHGHIYGQHSFGHQCLSGYTRIDPDWLFGTMFEKIFVRTLIPLTMLRISPHRCYADMHDLGANDSGSYTLQGPGKLIVGATTRRSNMYNAWRYTAYRSVFVDDVDMYPALLRCATVEVEPGVKAVANPFQRCLEDSISQRCDVPVDICRDFIAEFAERVYNAVPRSELIEVPLNQTFASYGVERTTVRPVDPTKSAGPGWPGSKGDYYTRRDDGSFVAGPQLAREYFVARDDLLRDDGHAESGWTTFPKDELRSRSKVESFATRFITNPAMHMYLLARAFLNPIIDVILMARFAVWFMVGCNAACDATLMVNHLAEVAPDLEWFDGDFIQFDEHLSSMVFRVLQAAALFVATLYRTAAEFRRGVHRIMAYLCPRYYAVDTMIVYGSHTNPSGAVGTTVWNCMAALFYMYCAYRTMAPPGAPSFWVAVRMLIYGDDFVLAAHPTVRSWFNPKTVADQVHLLFAQDVSAADKTAPTGKWTHATNITFLKRRFIKRADGSWTLALDMKSITKSLVYAQISGGVSPDKRDADCLVNAYRELWLHGVEVLDVWRPRLERAAAMLPVPVVFPSDETLETQYRAGTLHTWEPLE